MEPTWEVSFKKEGDELLAWGNIHAESNFLGTVIPRKEVEPSLVCGMFWTQKCGADTYFQSPTFIDTPIIIQSHKPALETPPPANIRQYIRSEFGSYLALILGLSLFVAPSVIIWALTRFEAGNSETVDKVGLLLWLYLQQASLLFLLAWNTYFQVEHALHADSRYTRWLEPVLGYTLRATGMLGYALVVRQIVSFGVCIQA